MIVIVTVTANVDLRMKMDHVIGQVVAVRMMVGYVILLS
jgi:hypothetical protein